MATSNKNNKTKAERETIRKGNRANPAEFRRILAEGPGEAKQIVTTAGTPSQVVESGRQRVAREDAAANFRDRHARITEYARRVKAGEMELKKVPAVFRDAVASDLGVKPLPKKPSKPKVAAEKPKTTTQVVDDARSAAKKRVAKSTPTTRPATTRSAPVARPSSGAKSTATSAPSTTKTKPATETSGAKKFTQATAKAAKANAAKAAVDANRSSVASKMADYAKGVASDIAKADKGAIVKEALVGKPGESKVGRFKAAGGVGGAISAGLSALALAGAAKEVPGKVKKFMDKYTEPKRLPAHPTKMNVTKTSAVKSTGESRPKANRPSFGKTATTVNRPSSAVSAAKGVHSVAKGDSLWAIAKSNNTTVDAILKVNPELAKRKAAGKTVLFSGTKVRIPKK